MAPLRATHLPVIRLSKDTVLLPGIIQRIPVALDRPDIAALLSQTYSRATLKKSGQRFENVHIACVPFRSHPRGQTNQGTIAPVEEHPDLRERSEAGLNGSANNELFGFGTAAKISGVEGTGTREFALIVEGIARIRIHRFTKDHPFIEAEVTYHYDEVSSQDVELQDLFSQLKQLSRDLLTLLRLSLLLPRGSGLSPIFARRLELFVAKRDIHEAGLLADYMSNVVDASLEDKLDILASLDVKVRLKRAIELLKRQVEDIKGNIKITSIDTMNVDMDEISNLNRQRMRRTILGGPPVFGSVRPSMPLMPVGPTDDPRELDEIDELKQKLDDAKLSPDAAKVADREIMRLKKMSPQQAEYHVIRTYLENLAEIPWSVTTDDRLNVETLARARKQLDDDHYGLEKVKKRLLEYLAVLKLKQKINDGVNTQIAKATEETATDRVDPPAVDERESKKVQGNVKIQILEGKRMVDKSPIILLVGPPGVGKTSLAKSVATALGRKFHRISLGGVRDEAEIRGHRRTYIAAMPGLIVNGLKKVGVANPVFLLDEIDKVGTSNFHGDPSAAMLEVLDPEQNHSFVDHYISIPIDLSRVLFIATANNLDTIPPPLLDRMEMIHLAGYTTLEKRHIAKRHLIPKQIRANGLAEDQLKIDDTVVSRIIESYTRESGVRNLEREIGSVCRAKAVEYADAQDAGALEKYNPTLAIPDIEEILGIEKFNEEIAEKTSRPGIVTGLVAYSTGGNGSILFIEVADMPGSGSVQLTGKLGDVLKESVEVALSWVKAHAYDLGLTQDPSENIMKNRSIHVHCPSGAIPKDGPSAGMAHTVALVSLFSGRAVPATMAMTGEISLRGRVLAVGGIKEKLIGALRAGVETVLLPEPNAKDVKDLPHEVAEGLAIIFVRHIWDAMRHVWPDAHWRGEQRLATFESRL